PPRSTPFGTRRQRQMCIRDRARAVLVRKQIFVMDEATSSVDMETERAIQKGIEEILEGRMSFLIAHRLSTIRSCDRILVIDRGGIVEQGTHEELMRRDGRYRTLYRHQFARESGLKLLQIRPGATEREDGRAGGERTEGAIAGGRRPEDGTRGDGRPKNGTTGDGRPENGLPGDEEPLTV
ncbi:MAG: ABC transporter ATP-binding protein, partial [Candidatus Eisenbacteria bacterium]|nr:ABC transporter ATP-binding protein [Candidatus Eisenbacteria bacterium]